MKTELAFVLNGVPVRVAAEPHARLLDVLRGPFDLVGTKEGCGQGECGSCTVIVDGRAVCACLYPALEVEGRTVTSIEGLASGSELSTLQRAFVEAGAIQCGFCSPGMILSAKVLLDRRPDPSDDEIRDALLGNLCRCTGYVQIVAAVKRAGAALRASKKEPVRG